jgi:hypothetical protein
VALSQGGGLLADVVAPVGYAVRGGPLAADLRRYKGGRDHEESARARERLRESLAAFLAGQGPSVWRAAGMAAGPSAAAVVPSGQGRSGTHPLEELVRSCSGVPPVPLVRLAVRPSEVHGRGVNGRWVGVQGEVAGADVLVVDDTWVSGGSAQSVAVALKLAGARRVAVVVLGRHVNPADRRSETFLAALSLSLSPGTPLVRLDSETMT